MGTLLSIVRAIVFAVVINRACADSSVGAVGVFAVNVALHQAAVKAEGGPSETTAAVPAGVSSATAAASGFAWQQPANMAGDTKEYLDALFQGNSEALEKVDSAWEAESKQGFRGNAHIRD
jgi:hypothetical protein